MKKSEIKELRETLIGLNEAYREGEPLVSDLEYDALVEQLRDASPNDEFFTKGIVEEATDRMEKLPLPMYSLEKIKTIKDLCKWLQKMKAAGSEMVVLMPKFDGISLLCNETDSGMFQAWTRGDGVEGQRSDAHFSHMDNGILEVEHTSMHTWGEAIMPKITFSHLKENASDFTYKNARNMVAGMFNSPTGWQNSYIMDVDYVRYGCDLPEDKNQQLVKLRSEFDNVSDSIEVEIDKLLLAATNNLLSDFIDNTAYPRFNKKYKIDGIVFEVNEYAVKEKLGRLPNGNPAYSIAFKREEWCDVYQTRVDHIEYGVGKTGVINPVIIIDPVEMDGATVSRATAYNMNQLMERHICEGALIEIIRSGDVIPKHLQTLEYNDWQYEKMMDEITECPSCGKLLHWDENHVHMVCKNPYCKERRISEIVYFFRTLGCEEFAEPTVRKMFDAGWITELSILEASKEQMQELLGDATGATVFDQIGKVVNGGIPYARVLTASNVFGGVIAETLCQKIIDGLPEDYQQWLETGLPLEGVNARQQLIDAITQIKGIGEAYATAFVHGLHKFLLKPYRSLFLISYFSSTGVVPVAENQMHVCMTGFRDKQLEEALKAQEHVVLNGVTKECDVLVVKDLNSTSSKMTTAKQRGIRIVTREEFEREILVQK